MGTLGERLAEAMKKKGMTQTDLADKVGVTQGTVWKILSGKAERSKFLPELARVLGVSLHWLATGEEDKNTPSESSVTLPSRKIPVTGTIQGGPARPGKRSGGSFRSSEDYFEYNSPDPNAYVLLVSENSMAPEIREGNYVLIEPGHEAKPGDIVLVKKTSGEVLLKIYRSDHDDEIVLESSNAPYESVILSKNEIVSIHPVSAVIFRRFIKRT